MVIQITSSKELGEINDEQPIQDRTQACRGENQKKWSKFTYQEVSALKNKDDLVAQLQTKYGLDKAQAQRDVDAFANGRQL
jgi:hypothetical protein